LHQPYWLVFLKFQSGAFPLHRIAKEYGAGFVISGHGHQFVRMERDGITYMEVGSSGARIKESFAQGLFYQHIWAEVKGTEVRFTVKELGAPFGKGRSFTAEDWAWMPKFRVGLGVKDLRQQGDEVTHLRRPSRRF